jgi:hypothetical protein
MPVLGATEADLKSIRIPACIIPGNDRTHAVEVGRTLARLLPDAELNELFSKNEDVDVVPPEEWQKTDGRAAEIFAKFLSARGISSR